MKVLDTEFVKGFIKMANDYMIVTKPIMKDLGEYLKKQVI